MIDCNKIKDEFTALPDGWIVLLETSIENINELNLTTLKALTEMGYSGVILSVNRPAESLLKLYESRGIDIERIYVIDCLTKLFSGEEKKRERVSFVESISDLTTLSIALDEVLEKISDKRFFFIDSITTMLVYNDPNTFLRFIHSELTKSRMNGISGLLISLEGDANREIRAEIAQLCDKVIKIGI